ncbi:MAG TPA: hypothetical protein VET85_04325, partial [Stellaceae bacterium]|nr:hypothetical protein [Stellaceae bacterium]
MQRTKYSIARRARTAGTIALGLLVAGTLSARIATAAEGEGGSGPLSDLSLSNFFTAGWGEAYVHRERASDTPDMALLRVQTNFLERELRVDYAHTSENKVPTARFGTLESADALIAYGLDRRWQVEVVTNYQFNTATIPGAQGASGSNGAGILRFQLVDTELSSYSFQLRVDAPNRALPNNTQTSVQYALAGFNDLYPLLGLYRTGLYYSLVYQELIGHHNLGQPQNDVIYDVTLAKTWTTMRTPVFGNFTTFLEANFTTWLD